jgi:DNA-binding winged helix-turn-helix (wHTH) protein/TolB-like protein
MSQESSVIYEFGRFRLDPASNLLTRDGLPLQPPGKIIDILKMLVQNAGEVVTTDVITEKVFPNASPGQEDVNSHISRLRKILEDAHEESRYVRSIAGQGFRFVEPVSELPATSCEEEIGRPSSSETEVPSSAKSKSNLGKILVVSATVLLLACVGSWAAYFRHSAPPAKPEIKIAVLPLQSLGTGMVDRQSNEAFTAALITELGKTFSVPSAVDVQGFADGFADPALTGRTLGVNAVITGLIQRAGSNVRVSLQMIDVKDGSPIWAGSFDGQSSDIRDLSEKMSAAVHRHFQVNNDFGDRQ